MYKMKFVLYFISFTLLCTAVISGLNCDLCSDLSYDGESTANDDCFRGVRIYNQGCGSTYYCTTKFILRNGLISSVERGCKDPGYDQDQSTNKMPQSNECETTISGKSETTSCYYSCNNKDNCNNITSTSLKSCQTNCSVNEGGGNCDYFAGRCVCNSGWSGTNCQIPPKTTYRKCLQCNQETDNNCASENSLISTQCPKDTSDKPYCAVSKTFTIGYGGIKRSVVTRGCTSENIEKESCQITSYTDGGLLAYDEYTCITTCAEDGCNRDTPDGIISESEKTLKCVQCDSDGNNCHSPATYCPAGSTHCKSTVSYYWDKSNSLTQKVSPVYKLINVVRECAYGPVETKCSSVDYLPTNLEKVTCTETCTTDGCNSKWPARPLCSQCSSSSTGSDCFESPPSPTMCTNAYDSYCTIQHSNRDGIKGYASKIDRSCSYYSIGTSCSAATFRYDEIRNCNRSCSTDGCNQGSGASLLTPSISLIMMSALWMVLV